MNRECDETRKALLRDMRTLQGEALLPAVARDHREAAKAERDGMPRVRSRGQAVWDYCRCLCYVFIACAFAGAAQGQTPFTDRVAQAQQTVSDLLTALQQTQALLVTAQQQSASDTATILALRTQVASLQAQLAAIPACPPVVICPVCPLPVVCPVPPPPPVVTPPPPLPAGSAALAWDAVAGATGYRVYYGTASGVYTQLRGAGLSTTATTYTVASLAPGSRYFFAVTAQNALAESAFSNEVFKDIGVVPPVADTTPPTVSITAPSPGATVVGTNILTATAADNVGVVGVQFGLDGANYAAEITVPPYTTIWNSTTVADGTHTLNAVARDAAGNRASSALVSVKVANAPAPPPAVSADCSTMPPSAVARWGSGTKWIPATQIVDAEDGTWTFQAAAQPGNPVTDSSIWRNGKRIYGGAQFAQKNGGKVCVSDFDSGNGWGCWDPKIGDTVDQASAPWVCP